jgi:hypothetical protein
VSSLNLGKSFLHLYCTEKVVSCNNFCFSTTSTFHHRILRFFSQWTTTISLPRGSRRRLLSLLLWRKALTTALYSKLPKSVQHAPLEPAKVFAPSVEVMGPAGPLICHPTWPLLPLPTLMRGTTTEIATGAIRPPATKALRWTIESIMRGWSSATSRLLVALRPDTWTHIRHPTATFTHTAFVCQMKRHRERAKCRQCLTAWSTSSSASSASSIQLQSFLGQVELIFYISLKFLKFTHLHCKLFPWSLLSGPLSVSTVWKEVGRLPVSLQPVQNYALELVPAAR